MDVETEGDPTSNASATVHAYQHLTSCGERTLVFRSKRFQRVQVVTFDGPPVHYP